MSFTAQINGPNHIRGVAGAVRIECLQRQDHRLRRDEMDNAGDHRAMAGTRYWLAVDDRGRRLIDNGGRRLIDPGSANTVDDCGRRLFDVALLISRIVISREVVTLHQDRHQDRMIGIDAGIDDRHDSESVDLVLALCGGHADNLSRRLGHISAPHGRAVVVDRCRIKERGGWGGRRIAARQNIALQIHFGAHDAQLKPQHAQEGVQRQDVRRGNQKQLTVRIAEPVVDVAPQQTANRLEQRQPAIHPHDDASASGGRWSRQHRHQERERDNDVSDALHDCLALEDPSDTTVPSSRRPRATERFPDGPSNST